MTQKRYHFLQKYFRTVFEFPNNLIFSFSSGTGYFALENITDALRINVKN